MGQNGRPSQQILPRNTALHRDTQHRQRRCGLASRYSQGDMPQHWPNGSETLVHFHKSFGVMQELFDHRDFTTFGIDIIRCAVDAVPCGTQPQPRFLDLGCAPGGFSACLLQDNFLGPSSVGFGVSLPPQMGGFQMAFASDRLLVQMEDIMALQSVDLLAANNSIDLCVADAQYLKNMFKERNERVKYRGLHVKSRPLGIWALTVKECQLAFAKLRQGGSFIFRFGWRGVGSADVHPTGEQVHPSLLAKYLEEEEWYKALTHWLFSVLKSLFTTLRPFKSEYVHQADVSFYMVCRNFSREKYEQHNWEAKLQRAFDELSDCEDEAALVAGIKGGISDEIKAEIDDLLEVVGRMRAIGIQSRKVTNPEKFNARYVQTPGQKVNNCDLELASSDNESNQLMNRSKQTAHIEPSDASATTEDYSATSSSSTPQTSDMDRKDFGAKMRRPVPPSSKDNRGLRWKAVNMASSQKESKQAHDALQRIQTPTWIGSTAEPHHCGEGRPVAALVTPWTTCEIESIAEVSCIEEFEVERAFFRQVHACMFQPKFQEWQQGEDPLRIHEQEVAAAQQVKRALHVQTFHDQLQRQRRQSREHSYEAADASVPHREQHFQCFEHSPMDSMSSEPAKEALRAMNITKSPVWPPNVAALVSNDGEGYLWTSQCQPDCGPSIRQEQSTAWPLVPSLADGAMPWWSPSGSLWSGSLPPASVPAPKPVGNLVDHPTPAVSSSKTAMERVKTPNSEQLEAPPYVATDTTRNIRNIPPEQLAARKVKQAGLEGALPLASKAVRNAGKRNSASVAKDAPDLDQALESDSLISSDEEVFGLHRKVYRHKRRAGRVVRERRMGRHRRNGALVAQSLGGQQEGGVDTWQTRIKVAASRCIAEMNQGTFFLHAMRFGLFCAMAWSMNSIIFSVLRLYMGLSLQTLGSQG